MKKIFKITLSVLLLFFVALYLGTVFLLPQIINSKVAINKLQSLILEKNGIETNITGLNLKISPKLTVILDADSINAKNTDTIIADIKSFSLNYRLLQKHLTLVSADNIFIDGNYLKQFKGKKKKKNKLELNDIPEIHIQKLVFKSDKVNINADNIDTEDSFIKLRFHNELNVLKNESFSGESNPISNNTKIYVSSDKEITSEHVLFVRIGICAVVVSI